jgi:hypothetical protein
MCEAFLSKGFLSYYVTLCSDVTGHVSRETDLLYGSDIATRQVYEEGAKRVTLSALNGINCEYYYILYSNPDIDRITIYVVN